MLGHLPWKTSASGLTAGEKFHRSCGKWGMKIYCGIASSLSERECALQSQSWTEYFMSLANVVCMIWTINQMLTACLGKRSVKWRRACTAQSKWHLGEKKRGKKKQGKECLWYWNDFTCIYSKRLETYIDLRRSWCEWRDSNQHSTLPSQVWFMPGFWQPFSWETLQNLLVYFLRKSNVLKKKTLQNTQANKKL